MNENDLKGRRDPSDRRPPMTNAEKQAAHRERKAAALTDLHAQLARLQGTGGSKAAQIAAAVTLLANLSDRLTSPTDAETADEIAASYAAAAEVIRARHHLAAALDIVQRNDAEAAALEAGFQRKAAREQRAARRPDLWPPED